MQVPVGRTSVNINIYRLWAQQRHCRRPTIKGTTVSSKGWYSWIVYADRTRTSNGVAYELRWHPYRPRRWSNRSIFHLHKTWLSTIKHVGFFHIKNVLECVAWANIFILFSLVIEKKAQPRFVRQWPIQTHHRIIKFHIAITIFIMHNRKYIIAKKQ